MVNRVYHQVLPQVSTGANDDPSYDVGFTPDYTDTGDLG
jgi:hypothetical protein